MRNDTYADPPHGRCNFTKEQLTVGELCDNDDYMFMDMRPRTLALAKHSAAINHQPSEMTIMSVAIGEGHALKTAVETKDVFVFIAALVIWMMHMCRLGHRASLQPLVCLLHDVGLAHRNGIPEELWMLQRKAVLEAQRVRRLAHVNSIRVFRFSRYKQYPLFIPSTAHERASGQNKLIRLEKERMMACGRYRTQEAVDAEFDEELLDYLGLLAFCEEAATKFPLDSI